GNMQMTRKRVCLLFVLGVILSVFGVTVAQNDVHTVFMPIGGGYSDTYDAFIAEALKTKVDDTLKIVVLPATYASNAAAITADELQENLDTAEGRRSEIEEACTAGVPEGVTCDVQLTPIFVRNDALDSANLDFFTDDVGAVYILGGDQTVAMQVLAGT